jgi:hypothetical protein
MGAEFHIGIRSGPVQENLYGPANLANHQQWPTSNNRYAGKQAVTSRHPSDPEPHDDLPVPPLGRNTDRKIIQRLAQLALAIVMAWRDRWSSLRPFRTSLIGAPPEVRASTVNRMGRLAPLIPTPSCESVGSQSAK